MKRICIIAVAGWIAYGCATTAPPQPVTPAEPMRGVASWYGQEFAGRTTANGEIFDPLLLTAAHRTLPFGTVVDVRNAKTNQIVRVRINDRGPFVGNRMIDLSYAAAQQIGLIDPGSGEVEVRIVSMGRGEHEPPAPFIAGAPDVPKPVTSVASAASDVPAVDFPLPTGDRVVSTPAPPAMPSTNATAAPPETKTAENDFHIEVQEQHGGEVVETRRQVAADGKTVETVPVAAGTATPVVSAPGHSASSRLDAQRQHAAAEPLSPPHAAGKFVVQVGAFSIEGNAKSLLDRLTRIGQQAFIDHEALYRVRIGPFATREQAIKARESLEANGISAIIVAD